MTPAQALTLHSGDLTQREQTEILEFQTVFFLAAGVPKLQASASLKPNFGYDDSEGYYRVVIGDHIAFRFEILAALGSGSFGQVVRAYDHKRQEEVAIKILVNEKMYNSNGAVETKILDKLRTEDPEDTCGVIRMKTCFTFRQHICITFELLSISLWDYLRSQDFARTSRTLLRRLAVQLLTSLAFITRLNIVHCDIKPENILLKHQFKSQIKLIDFGSACFVGKKPVTYMQSRFYRAPEVILRLPFTTAIDMWSFGCVLAEMYTGKALFPAEDEAQLLYRQMELLGRPPKRLVVKSSTKLRYFNADLSVKVCPDLNGNLHEPGTSSLAVQMKCDDAQLLDLLAGCLAMDPTLRITAEEALRHPWLSSLS